MNSSRRANNAQKAAAPLNNYEFDFGLSSFPSKSQSNLSLNAQKQNPPAPPPRSSSSAAAAPWSHQPPPPSSSTPSWTPPRGPQQPLSGWTAGAAGRSQSMVGDVSGKSWGKTDSSRLGNSGIIGDLGGGGGARADMFGDLLGAALGRSSASVPLKKQAPQPGASISMANVAGTLPNAVSMKNSKAAKARSSNPSDPSEMGDFVQATGAARVSGGNDDLFDSAPVSSQDAFGPFEGGGGGDPFGDFSVGGSAAPPPANEDPFAASSSVHVDLFGDSFSFTKPSAMASEDPFNLNMNVGGAATSKMTTADPFGFAGPSVGDTFSSFQSAQGTPGQASNSGFDADPFEVLLKSSASRQNSAQLKTEDPLEKFWASAPSSRPVSRSSPDPESWGLETDFVGDEGGTTTELEGLPPPPSGVTASLAKDKGVESFKQGQFADAIKWLSWAADLLESSRNDAMLIEVLTCRVSCFKEVGEYKKAIADCCKVLEQDQSNMAMLLQRALLYESTEKYKLGVVDLRELLKRDPHNRVAGNTLTRLSKMVEAG